MNVSEILYRVRAAIDELGAIDSPELGENPNSDNLDRVILDKVSYALEWVIQNAPPSLLEGGLTTQLDSRGATYRGDKAVEIEIPSDVLRIISARLSSWIYSPAISDEHSDTAKMQGYPTTRGTWDAPACILYNEDNKQILRMFSAKGGQEKAYISVIKKPNVSFTDSADGVSEVSIPSRLEASFIYYISALTMQAMGENPQTFFEVAQQNLNGNGK